jgi:hypothetical protein
MDLATRKLIRTFCTEVISSAVALAKRQELDPSFFAFAVAYPDGEAVAIAVSRRAGDRDPEMGEEITGVFETACELARRRLHDRRRGRSRPEVKPS